MSNNEIWKPSNRERRWAAQAAREQLSLLSSHADSSRELNEQIIRYAEKDLRSEALGARLRRVGQAVLGALISAGTAMAIAEGWLPPDFDENQPPSDEYEQV